jgi:hypothetical protein
LGLLLFAGILLRSAILEYFVTPIALVFWMFWRILQSVDQIIYWVLLIFAALLAGILRLARSSGAPESEIRPGTNATLETVNHWRTLIQITRDEIDDYNLLRRDLGSLLIALIASRQPDSAQWEILTRVRLGQIPLPGRMRAFLFPAETPAGRRSFQHVLQTLRQAPRKWIRRWRGRDLAEYYQSIDEVLTLMESGMETPYENNDRANRTD